MKLLAPHERPASDPSLIYEDKALAGQPALHALIAGVSDYPNLPGAGEQSTATSMGMRRLTSTSLSAYLILDWLLNAAEEERLALPLGTVRVLLSPTATEVAATTSTIRKSKSLPAMTELQVPRCNLDTLSTSTEGWRRSAKGHRDGATFFYFSGHGIQRAHNDQLLLLDTFGSARPLSWHSVDVRTLRNGMTPYRNANGLGTNPDAVRPDIARTQFYFVDACRSVLPELIAFEDLKAGEVWNVESADMVDDRGATVFSAAVPAGRALALKDTQTLFSMALLRCLRGEAATAPDRSVSGRRSSDWHISGLSLHQGLQRRLDEVNSEFKGNQAVTYDGASTEAVLCYLSGRPDVPLKMIIDPQKAVGCTRIYIQSRSDAQGKREFHSRADPYPFTAHLQAGYYEFRAALDAPTAELRDFADAEPYLVAPLQPRVWKATMSDER